MKLNLLRERFTIELVHVSRRWRWCLDRRLRSTGLTQARWTTLLQLSRGGEGMTQRDLAAYMNIEGATLVPLLDSLAAMDLVERRSDPSDRRRKTVHLTPVATPVLAAIGGIANDLRGELTADISADDLATALRVLSVIRERLESVNADGRSS